MTTPSAPEKRVAHALITSDRIEGALVFNPDGDHIGHIDQLSIDKLTGQVKYVLMSFGGFLGIGEKFHPLPWDVLRYDTEKDGYVVPLDKARLENAPSYTRGELEQFGGGERYAEELTAYYGLGPYW